jgi:alpha-1,6-mannosyltransferase
MASMPRTIQRAVARATLAAQRTSEFVDTVEPIRTGLLGSILVFLGSLQPNSPFTSKIPGSWFLGVSQSPHASPLLIDILANAVVYLGLILSGIAWVRLVRLARLGSLPAGWWLIFLLWVTPLMVAGPLFSRDVYSYAAQGQMVTQGMNPYHGGPNLLGASPFLPAVDPLWGNAPAPYGPLFLATDGGLVTLAGHSPLLSVALLRLLALVSVAVSGVAVSRIARRLGVNEALALALTALNPIFLYTLASAGHNDAYMVALMLIGVDQFLAGRRLVGIVVVSLAAAVKIPAIVVVGFLGYHWSEEGSLGERVRSTLVALAIAGTILWGLGAITGLGMGWLPALSTPGSVYSFEDPLVAVGYAIGWLSHAIGLGIGPGTVVSVLRDLGDLVLLGVSGLVLLGSRRETLLRSAGIVLLASVVLGPVIWPWYLTWAIALLAIGAGELTSSFLVLVTVSALPIDLLGLPTVLAWVGYVGLAVVVRRHWGHVRGFVDDGLAEVRRHLEVLAARLGWARSAP